jgi:hypothetical protein
MKTFIFLLTFVATPGYASVSQAYIKNSIKKAAKEVGVPPELLSAICWAESLHKAEAYVHGDMNGKVHAFGICQVLYTTAVDMGMRKDSNCERDFRSAKSRQNAGIPSNDDYVPPARNHANCILFGPYTNAFFAAKFLKQKLDQYDGSWISAIAAYNSGTVRTCPAKGYFTLRTYRKGVVRHQKVSCVPGGLLNQKYVDRVLLALKEKR